MILDLKYKKLLFFIVTYILSAATHLSFPQKVNIRFKHYTTDQGLGQNRVDCILKDNQGFMWFGTWDGLNRFDGHEFIKFKHDKDKKNTISNNKVRDMCQDNFGNIWIATASGLNVFFPDTRKTINYYHNPNNENSIISNNIEDITLGNKGEIIIGTYKGMDIIEVEGKNGKISNIQHFPTDCDTCLPGKSVFTVFVDRLGVLWIGTDYGLLRYDRENGKRTHYVNDPSNPNSLSSNSVYCIYQDYLGTIWIGTVYGLNRLEEKTGEFTVFTQDNNSPNRLLNSTIRAIMEDCDNNLLVGTLGGLSFFDREMEGFHNHIHNIRDKYSLNNIFVNSIFADSIGNVWIGTEKGGVNYYNTNQMKIESYTYDPDNPNTLNANIINSIFEEKDALWIGTAGGGLNKYDKTTGKYRHYVSNPNNPHSISLNYITSIVRDKSGDLWAGTWGMGLNQLTRENEEKGIFVVHDFESEGVSLFPNNFISSLIQDDYGNLWIGSLKGLSKYNPFTKKFNNFVDKNNKSVIEEIGCLGFDLYGNLWVGTINGLFKLSPKEKGEIGFDEYNLVHFTLDTLDNQSLSDNYVISICSDSKGKLWFGTYGGGVNFTIPDSVSSSAEKFTRFTEKDGLSNNIVYGILEDNYGNIWTSTDNGLSRLNPETKKFINFYKEDGILSNQFYWSAFHKNNKGKLYFGGLEGMIGFFPDTNFMDEIVPKVMITDLKICDIEITPGIEIYNKKVLDKDISKTAKITLSHTDNFISFKFAALEYKNPLKNQFAYILEGFEKEWHFIGNQHSATYTNLSAGSYTFKVKATNIDGVWAGDMASVKITILPPWWNTWWFKVLLAIIVAGVAFAFYYIRINQIKAQKLELENQVANRTRELKEAYDNMNLLSEFGKRLTSTLSLKAINEMIFNYVNLLMDTSAFGIGIYNKSNNSIKYSAFIENGVKQPPFNKPLTSKNCLSAACFNSQKTIFINDLYEEYVKYIHSLPNISISGVPHSIIHIPLTVEDKKIGVITVNSYKKNAYSENDLANLQTLASYVAVALDNARVYGIVEKNNMMLNTQNVLLKDRQKQIEEQSKELNLKNASLKKLVATKDKFFSIIAHDLKSPFNSIIGFADLLITKFDSYNNEKRLNFIKIIRNSSKNIFGLLENLLQWSRSQTGVLEFNPQTMEIGELIQANINLVANQLIEKEIELVKNIPPKVKIKADWNMIDTVFRNLMTNAIKFTDNGQIIIEVNNRGNFISTMVKDTGVGIASNKLKNLFDIAQSKSTSGTRGEQGTGLGLIICKEFIEKHGGRINVKSEEGKGTEFSFTIPVA